MCMIKLASARKTRSDAVRDYLEWITSEETMRKIAVELHCHRSSHKIDPVVFVTHRVNGIRQSGAVQASYKLRQLFDIAGPHGELDISMLLEIERDRY